MKTVKIKKYFNSFPSGKWHFFDIVDNQGKIYHVSLTLKSPLKEKEVWFLQSNEKEFHSLQKLVEHTILPKESESLIKNRLIKEVL